MSSMDDYRDPSRMPKKKSPLRAFYPVIGLLILIAAGAAGYFARVPAYAWLRDNTPLGTVAAPAEQMEIAVGIVIAMSVLLLSAFLFALVQPRDKAKSLVKESALRKEREAMDAERRAKKRRQKEMRRKMKQRNR